MACKNNILILMIIEMLIRNWSYCKLGCYSEESIWRATLSFLSEKKLIYHYLTLFSKLIMYLFMTNIFWVKFQYISLWKLGFKINCKSFHLTQKEIRVNLFPILIKFKVGLINSLRNKISLSLYNIQDFCWDYL